MRQMWHYQRPAAAEYPHPVVGVAGGLCICANMLLLCGLFLSFSINLCKLTPALTHCGKHAHGTRRYLTEQMGMAYMC